MKYRSPKLAVDGIVLRVSKILLIKRKNMPFKNRWALPGGFVEYGETTEHAAVREILEETGLETNIKDLFGVYSDPDRDPRGHVVSVVYLLEEKGGDLLGGDDASEAKFFEIDNPPELSFDHDKILEEIIRRYR